MRNVTSLLNRLLTIVGICMLLTCAGCVVGRGYAGAHDRNIYGDRLILSPDHGDAAYVWTDELSSYATPLLWPPMPIFYAQNELLGWSSAGGQKNHLLEIQRYDVFLEYPTQYETKKIADLRYSPDSAHLAAKVWNGEKYNRIEVIDVNTEQRTQLRLRSPGSIRQMRWVSPSEIAYVASVGEGRPWLDPMKQILFIQDVAVDSDPKEVFSGEPSLEDSWSPRWFFSPDAKSVLVAATPVISILDLSTGQVSPLMKADQLILVKAIWKADGRAAALFFGDVKEGPWFGPDEPMKRVVLANLDKGTITELTDGLQEIESPWKLRIAFAGEDRLVFVKERQVHLFNVDEKGASPAGSWKLPDHRGGYHPLLPGWVVAGPTGLSNGRNSTAVSYDRARLVHLSDHHCVVSDDGSRIAEVIRKGKVTVRPFELPALCE